MRNHPCRDYAIWEALFGQNLVGGGTKTIYRTANIGEEMVTPLSVEFSMESLCGVLCCPPPALLSSPNLALSSVLCQCHLHQYWLTQGNGVFHPNFLSCPMFMMKMLQCQGEAVLISPYQECFMPAKLKAVTFQTKQGIT